MEGNEPVTFDQLGDSATPSSSELKQEVIVKSGGGDGKISDDEVEALSQPDAKKEKPQVTEEKVQQAEIAKTIAKMVKLKAGDKDLEVPEDALIPVKINGKVETIPLAKMRDTYNLAENFHRKTEELAKERKQFYDERGTIQSRIDEIHRLAVTEKNPRMAIEFLAEAMGADPQEIWTNLIAPIEEALRGQLDLTPEQASAKKAQEELEYYRKRDSLAREREAKARETEQLKAKITETISANGMTQEQFNECYRDLVAEAARTGFDANNLTPEMVGQYYQIIDRRQKIASMTQDLDPKVAETASNQLYDIWSKDPSLTKEDIADIAVQVWGKKQAKPSKVVERVKEQRKTTNQGSNANLKPIESWDDL